MLHPNGKNTLYFDVQGTILMTGIHIILYNSITAALVSPVQFNHSGSGIDVLVT